MNASWFRIVAQIAPWLTLVLVLQMFSFLHSALAPSAAVAIDLPDTSMADTSRPGLVAMILPDRAKDASRPNDVLAFFDDDRFVISSPAGSREFVKRLGARASATGCGALTLLCDRQVPAGDLMRVMELAKSAHMQRIQIAEKHD